MTDLSTDLGNSVILPREDYDELQSNANGTTPTTSERIASVLHTSAIFGSMAGAVLGASWAYSWARDWRERRQHERQMKQAEFQVETGIRP